MIFLSPSLVSFTTPHEIVYHDASGTLWLRPSRTEVQRVTALCFASADVREHDDIHMCRLSGCFASALDPGPFWALGKHHSVLLTLHKHFGQMQESTSLQ